MMGIELHAPTTHKSNDQIASFDIQKSLVEEASDVPSRFPIHPDQNPDWTPAAPMPTPENPDPTPRSPGQPPRDQWEVVEDKWKAVDDTKTNGCVDAWAGVLGWKGKIGAKKPNYLIENFGNLYLEAPHLCGTAAA